MIAIFIRIFRVCFTVQGSAEIPELPVTDHQTA